MFSVHFFFVYFLFFTQPKLLSIFLKNDSLRTSGDGNSLDWAFKLTKNLTLYITSLNFFETLPLVTLNLRYWSTYFNLYKKIPQNKNKTYSNSEDMPQRLLIKQYQYHRLDVYVCEYNRTCCFRLVFWCEMKTICLCHQDVSIMYHIPSWLCTFLLNEHRFHILM